MELNLPNKETQERIAKALEELAQGKTPTNKTIYGVRGLGQENPILMRTYDARGITIDLTTNGDFKEAVASDVAFQEFFHFPEHTDELGNVFITITPKSFRFDLTSKGENLAISVKEYEDGDEELGFIVHPAFKKWLTETTWDGVGSIQLAKYNNSAYDVVNEEVANGFISNDEQSSIDPDNVRARSVAGEPTDQSYATWNAGWDIVKNTHPNYGLLHWMYRNFIDIMNVIFYGRIDINNFYDIDFDWDFPGDEKSSVTGNTDGMNSHSGYNTATRQWRVFGLDDYITGTTITGCYVTIGRFVYSHLFDFDPLNSEGGLTSSLNKINNYDGEGDIITKLGFDPQEPFFTAPLAVRPVTSEFPENAIQNIYYCSKGNVANDSALANNNDQNNRGQLYAYSFSTQIAYPDNSIFYSRWNLWFGFAWNDGYLSSARLCKPPF